MRFYIPFQHRGQKIMESSVFFSNVELQHLRSKHLDRLKQLAYKTCQRLQSPMERRRRDFTRTRRLRPPGVASYRHDKPNPVRGGRRGKGARRYESREEGEPFGRRAVEALNTPPSKVSSGGRRGRSGRLLIIYFDSGRRLPHRRN